MLKIGRGLVAGRIHAPSAPGSPYLDGVVTSAVLDLDATIAASYAGTGTTWANLVAAPADGSATTAYDFYTGNGSTATTYPSFNGSAGNAAAYWGFDGGDYFLLKSGTNTNFINDLHKSAGGDFWVAITFRIPDLATTSGLYTTQSGTSSSGLRAELTNTENINSQQRGDSTSATTVALAVGASTGTDHILLMSHSNASNNWRVWLDTVTAANVAQTFVTATTAASAALTIATRLAATGRIDSGARLYSFAMGNEYLDNTKAAAIINHLEIRHGRNYAP